MSDLSTKLRPYEFHGVVIQDTSGKHAKADCPFCGKESHMGINQQTGQFRCVRCGEEGNIASFLQKLHAESLKQTKDKDYSLISKERGIPVVKLKQWGLAKSFINDEWLLPMHNNKGKLANLCKVVKVDGKWKALSTPDTNLHPFGTNLVNKNTRILWVCEGPWDGMALSDALSKVKAKDYDDPSLLHDALQVTKYPERSLLANGHSVISSPGANVFNADWLEYFADRTVFLCFDNDHPKRLPTGKILKAGWDGMKRIVRMAAESQRHFKTIHRLRWGVKGHDPELPNGYDIRDLIKQHGTLDAVKIALGLLEATDLEASSTIEEKLIDPIDTNSFSDLCKHFKEKLHFSNTFRDSLAISLSVVYSTALRGSDQIWIRVIGPPGSGKSTIAECISADKDNSFPISKVTGFHSGCSAGPRRKDPSLIPKMNGKTVIIKDADTLCSSPARDTILAELRDIFDGVSRSVYRTGKEGNFESITSTFMLCGTDELRSLNRSALGDRFLDCEILGNEEQRPFLDAAFNNTFAAVSSSFSPPENEAEAKGDRLLHLKRVTVGFIRYLKGNITNQRAPSCSKEAAEQIKSLGQYLSYMRASVSREGTDMNYRPRAELATRLVSQLTKLAIALCIVLDKKEIDKEVVRLITKVVTDTADKAAGFRKEIFNLLYKYSHGLATRQMATQLQLAESTCRKMLLDMQELKIVHKVDQPNNSGIRGRATHLWRLVPNTIALYEEAYSITKKPLKSRPSPIKKRA